jgi:hypothetical protein
MPREVYDSVLLARDVGMELLGKIPSNGRAQCADQHRGMHFDQPGACSGFVRPRKLFGAD